MKYTATLFFGLLCLSLQLRAEDSPRQHTRLDDDWKFTLGDPPSARTADFNDGGWRAVILPHDWSIEGHIGPKEPTGGGGGFFPAGIGWYRHHINAPAEWKSRRVQVEFEGVYEDADVFLNGQKLASHPYGYTSFFVDLTSALKPGMGNVLAVRVDDSHQKNSRWYSGSGIYRHVWLTVTRPTHMSPWGVFVSTPRADARSPTLAVQTQVTNDAAQRVTATVQTTIEGPSGETIGSAQSQIQLAASGTGRSTETIQIENPPLWSPENPRISSAITRVLVGGAVVDQVTTRFGVREIAWSSKNGLTLNGKSYKLSGGCIHHDNGVLGACAFDRAEERKIQLLKAAGFNAIRTAHNPPSPALLDACDRLGMLVLDEAFDCWVTGKNSQDYHLFFKDWWQRDMDSMVERDRNHPSVIMWSVGNEIPGLFGPMGAEYAPQLSARIHALDPTRPVTNGINGWPNVADPASVKDAETVWNALDIVGTNYRLGMHIAQRARFPAPVLVSTESSPPIGEARRVLENPYIVGDFVWTALDYLGESGIGRWFYEGDPSEPLSPKKPGTPPGKINPVGHGSDSLYPWHGSNCGDIDLIGYARPAAHLRNMMWNMGEKLAMGVRQPEDGKKVIVVGWGWFPTWESWTWPGEEAKPMQVEVYSTSPQVRLYLNGKSLGDRKIQDCRATYTVIYQPGSLKAVRLENGKESGSITFQTAGAPVSIRLTPDRTLLHADAQDLSFVNVEVVDQNGEVQPNANEEVTFDVSGPATIAGLGNADMQSQEPYQGKSCRVFHGRALVVLRTTHTAGLVTLKASADGLQGGSATVQIKRSVEI